MAYRTYLFDLDGTVLDSVELIVSSHRHTQRQHLGISLPDPAIVACMGRTLQDIYAELASSTDQAAAMIETYRRYNLERHDSMVSAYPGVAGALTALHARGARLAIVTSKRSELALRGLKVAGLGELCSLVVGSDHVSRGKPDPEPVRLALARLDADPATTVMVGDSPHDLHAGRAATVATAAVGWGPFPHDVLHAAAPDHFVAQPEDLLALEPNGSASRTSRQ